MTTIGFDILDNHRLVVHLLYDAKMYVYIYRWHYNKWWLRYSDSEIPIDLRAAKSYRAYFDGKEKVAIDEAFLRIERLLLLQ